MEVALFCTARTSGWAFNLSHEQTPRAQVTKAHPEVLAAQNKSISVFGRLSVHQSPHSLRRDDRDILPSKYLLSR